MPGRVCRQNLLAHLANITQAFLSRGTHALFWQAHSSSSLALWDFCLFPNLKITLKEKHLESQEEIMGKAMVDPSIVSQRKCYQQQQKHLVNCVNSKGSILKAIKEICEIAKTDFDKHGQTCQQNTMSCQKADIYLLDCLVTLFILLFIGIVGKTSANCQLVSTL